MEKLTLTQFLNISKETLRGKVFVFPTDTVYGVGAMIDDKIAIDRIYQMKQRDQDKPLANLCSNVSQIKDFVEEISNQAFALMDKYWPGPLTLIFKKKQGIYVENTKDTIAFRMPNSKISLAIIDHLSILSTTSVNLSGMKELNNLVEIEQEFQDKIDYLIMDEQILSSIPSTVVDVSRGDCIVIRKGTIQV